MKTIAIIDDDIHIGNMLEEVLAKEGYGVLRAYSGTEALMLLATQTPDLVLLDLMLPGLSGEEILPKIKNIPVIVVSAKIDVDNKVDLLLGGAVDYVTKPFGSAELLARVRSALRTGRHSAREGRLAAGRFVLGDLEIDYDARRVFLAGQEIRLTQTEYNIVALLS